MVSLLCTTSKQSRAEGYEPRRQDAKALDSRSGASISSLCCCAYMNCTPTG